MSLEMQGLFPLIGWLDTFLFKHIPNKANADTQVQSLLSWGALLTAPDLMSQGTGGWSWVWACSGAHHAVWGQCCWHESDLLWHRVADIHLRGHLIARFTSVEQSKDISLWSTRHIGEGFDCTKGVPYTVEDQAIYYLRFSHVISCELGKISVSKKTDWQKV